MNAQQLKNAILQEAIEGRLVPQDPNDEPASVLLERIRAEKERLVKEGKLKKKDLEVKPISEDEIPFEIPESWEWCKLGWIGSWGSGATPSKGNPEFYNNGTIPWLRTGELNNGYVYDSEIKVTEKALEKCSLRMCQRGDVLIAMYGATIGKVAIAGIELTTNQACCACTPYLIYNKYLLYYLLASKKTFIEMGEGGAQPNISREKILAFPFALPPLAEQHRIVAKIEELLPKVEKYGKAQDELNKLNEELPEKLKKSILQEAIEGRLVPQDPNDEPASVLLDKIREEKKQLVKEGKLKKKDLEEKPISEDEIPFEIPESWEWVRLKDVVSFIGGYAYDSQSFISSSSYQVLRLGNIKNDSLLLNVNPVFISQELAEETQRFSCKDCDILITMTGTRKKRDYFYSVLIDDTHKDMFVNQRVGCLRLYNSSSAKWLIKVLKTETVLQQVFQYETGTANQGNLGAENILKTLIPLPPLEEQKRIVVKIEELFQKIDGLKK